MVKSVPQQSPEYKRDVYLIQLVLPMKMGIAERHETKFFKLTLCASLDAYPAV
jgi:hypothetical protein